MRIGVPQHQTLQHFFGVTHEGIWKMLFKGKQTWPKETEDRGYNLTHPASPVSLSHFKVYPLLAFSGKVPKPPYLFFQGWTKKVAQIQCPAPLPKEPAIPVLTRCWFRHPIKHERRRPRGPEVASAAMALRT